jgi:hypothetical protein
MQRNDKGVWARQTFKVSSHHTRTQVRVPLTCLLIGEQSEHR